MSSLTSSKKSKINKNYYLYIITQYQPTLCSPSALYNDIKHGGIGKSRGRFFSVFASCSLRTFTKVEKLNRQVAEGRLPRTYKYNKLMLYLFFFLNGQEWRPVCLIACLLSTSYSKSSGNLKCTFRHSMQIFKNRLRSCRAG